MFACQINFFLRIVLLHYMMLESLQSQIIGSQYFHMNYTGTNSFVLQTSLTNKLQCFALCARQWTQCNIATYNSMSKPSCLLSNETFVTHNLVPMNNSIVIDFRRCNTKDSKTLEILRIIFVLIDFIDNFSTSVSYNNRIRYKYCY